MSGTATLVLGCQDVGNGPRFHFDRQPLQARFVDLHRSAVSSSAAYLG
jgi:hypothetical protein